MFKKVILPAIAATALSAVAVPAMASHDHRGWERIDYRLERLDRRIEQGVRSGQLTRREAYRLRAQFSDLVRLEQHYLRTGRGLDRREMADLNYRFDRLNQQIRWERRDRERVRYDRYGRDYGRYGGDYGRYGSGGGVSITFGRSW